MSILGTHYKNTKALIVRIFDPYNKSGRKFGENVGTMYECRWGRHRVPIRLSLHNRSCIRGNSR
jgi:hypothetical protein